MSDNERMKELLIIAFVLIATGLFAWQKLSDRKATAVTNFEECARAGGSVFTENIGDALEKSDLIRLTAPRSNQVIASPLTIEGEARGVWFF